MQNQNHNRAVMPARDAFVTIILATAGLILFTASPVQALIARGEIESIRSLNLLTEQDLQKVQTFVQEQFRAIAQAKDASDLLSPIRNLIENSHSNIKRPTIEMAYSNRYAQSVKKSYKMAFSPAAGGGNSKLTLQIQMAATVIVAKTDNINLIDDLVSLLQNKVSAVRYWAAKGLSMPGIQGFLAKANTDNAKAKASAQAVISALQSAAQTEQSALVIGQIAYAAPAGLPASVQLLQTCVARRLNAYKQWQVNDELTDWQILQKIFDTQEKASPQSAQSHDLMLIAAKLYTAVCERYKAAMTYKGTDGHVLALLPQANQNALQTILIEGEKKLMLLAKRPPEKRFENAIKTHRWSRLTTSLLAILRAVNQKFNIYPKGRSASASTLLVKLSRPPQKVIQRAIILRDIKTKGKVVGSNNY